MHFNWQTDEQEWDEQAQETQSNSAVSPSRFPLLITTLAALLIVSGAVFIFRQVQNRVDSTTSGLSGDLLAAYELLNSAVYGSDAELFQSFLPERNTYSRQLPLDLFRYGYYLDRPFLKLTAVNLPPPEEAAVTFSPDLSRAEVVALQAYRPDDNPEAGPIWLERLTLFRQEDGRWQLTRWPIDEDFWGETVEEEIGLLRAEYPGRDEDIGRRLAGDVSLLLDEICGHAAINCPPNFRLKMLLVPYGQNLLDMNDNYRTLPLSSGYDAYRIFLPAPTLVGRPIDEAGYQTFYQGYGGWIAAVLVQHYSRIRPVTVEVTADFLAQWQLSPPPSPVLPGPVLRQAQQPGASTVSASASSATDASAGSATDASTGSVSDVELPEQDIYLVCQGYSPPAWLAYSPAEDSWRTISQPENAPALAQLLLQAGEHSRFPPEGQGTLIRRPFYTNGVQSWHSYLWLGGLASRLESDNNPGLILADPRHQVPDPGYLLFYPFDGQGNPFRADTTGCLNDDCRLEPLAGFPVWSPSGEQTLLAHNRGDGTPQIYLGDNEGRPIEFLTNGYSPQWLDENSFLYLGSDEKGIFLGRFDNGVAAVERIDHDPLFNIEEIVATTLTIFPTQPERLFITTSTRGEFAAEPTTASRLFPADMLLIYDRGEPILKSLYTGLDLDISLPLHFSGDGRFLTLTAFEPDELSGGWHILVFDLDIDPIFEYYQAYETNTAYFDWSADSEWLLIAEEDALRLIAPRHNIERHIPHTLGCHTVGWAKDSGQWAVNGGQ